MGHSWEHHGNFMAGSQKYHVEIVGMSWECHGDTMGISRETHKKTMGRPWEYHGNIGKIIRISSGGHHGSFMRVA